MRSPQRLHNCRQSPDSRDPNLTSLNSTLNKFVGCRQKPWMLNSNSNSKTSIAPPSKLSTPSPAPNQKLQVPFQPRDIEMDNERRSTSDTVKQPTPNNTQGQSGPDALSSKELPISPVSPDIPSRPAPVSASASPHISNSCPTQASHSVSIADRQFGVLPSPDSNHGCSTRATSETRPSDNFIPEGVSLSPHQSGPPQLVERELQTISPSFASADDMGHSSLPMSQTARVARTSQIPVAHQGGRAQVLSCNSAMPQQYQPQKVVPANPQLSSDMTNKSHASLLKFLFAEPISPKRFIPLLDRISAAPGSCEKSRIHLLRNACEKGDLFYIALHQVYCLQTTCPSSLDPSKFGSYQMAGLELVSRILIRNECLSKPFVEACARFPTLIGEFLRYCSIYSSVLDQVIRFLEAMARSWLQFETSITSRGYPPLIDEMIDILGLTTPTFQYVIFTSCCRRLTGATDDVPVKLFTAMFRKNEEYYQQRRLRMHSANPIPLSQVQAENEFLRQQYLRISEQHVLPKRVLHGAIIHQWPLENTGANFRITDTGGPQVQTQDPVTQEQQQPPIRRSYHQDPSPYPPLASHPTQYSLQPNRQYASMPVPNRAQMTVPSYTRAHPAPPAGWSMTAQPLPNQVPPNSTRFVLSHNMNTQLRNDVFVHPSAQLSQTQPTAAQPLYPKTNTLLLPPPGILPMESANPNPLIDGLHQAYLKEQIVALHDKEGSNGPTSLFPYLHSFALFPIQLQAPIRKLQFTIPPEEFQKFPFRRKTVSKNGSPVWGVLDGCRTYQIRCTKTNSPIPKLSEHQWAVSDTAWPTAIYIHVNGMEHFVRRKMHFGRDIPLNVTSSLKEGLNEISIAILWGSPEYNSKSSYAVALEILEYASLNRVRSLIQHQKSATSLDQIKHRLTGLNADDDDISVVDDHITIDLVDPFMARVFDTPARSKFCPHMECFDIETFLMTRLSKASKGYGMAEDWKCPICGNDARPQSLIIDDFLVTVRRTLDEGKQLDAKAILVRPDGSWEPKTERNNDNNNNNNRPSEPGMLKRKREDGLSITSPNNHGQQQLYPNRLSKQSSTPEVIELD
ncbi:MIZ zinc finger protein [Histoplasma ohiense]|nr:MIZ zinc finger protein [Histoplasma ohiense (nom. inval.)]